MSVSESINPEYNFALSQVFSSSLAKKINDPSHEQKLKELLHITNLYPLNQQWDIVKGLEITYNYLKQNYRCEYVYMNEIANQLLLKFHNDNSATLLKELTSEYSIADIVIINGDTVAYEIKTELDTFDRLDKQLESYQALYDQVYVVSYPGAFEALSKKIDHSIGIIVLEDNGQLKTIRKAEKCSHKFNSLKAVYTLRQSELVAAYEKYVGRLPIMGTALIYGFCYNWYVSLEKEDAHVIFYEALKSRKPSSYQFKLISNCSPSLRMIFFSKSLSKKYCNSAIKRFGIFD